jgi:hypothetical protein
MATSGGPICTFIYLMSLIASGNDLRTAYHAIYSILIFLPILAISTRWRMQDGELFQRSNFKAREIPWTLLLRKYWRILLGTVPLSPSFSMILLICKCCLQMTSPAFLLDADASKSEFHHVFRKSFIYSPVPGKDVRTVALWQLYLALMPVPGVLVGA